MYIPNKIKESSYKFNISTEHIGTKSSWKKNVKLSREQFFIYNYNTYWKSNIIRPSNKTKWLELELRRLEHTHETWRIGFVSPDLPINQNMSLHQNGNDFTVSESIFQPVSQDNDQWQAFPGLVRSRWRLRCLRKRYKNKINEWSEPLEI